MAQHNFENKIKEQLQQREIKPSADSWDKLSAKLDAHKSQKSSNNYWWVGIAAAVAVGIFIGALLFNNSPSEEIQIVETPVEEIKNEVEFTEETQIASEEKIEETITTEEAVFSNSKKSGSGDVTYKKASEVVKVKENKLNKNTAVAQNEARKTVVAPAEIQKEEIIDKDISEALAQNIQQETNTNLEPEVDALLSGAKKRITPKQSYNSQTAVAGNNLLQDAEAELERSFRNQVFEVLKDGFYKVKTAVADRE